MLTPAQFYAMRGLPTALIEVLESPVLRQRLALLYARYPARYCPGDPLAKREFYATRNEITRIKRVLAHRGESTDPERADKPRDQWDKFETGDRATSDRWGPGVIVSLCWNPPGWDEKFGITYTLRADVDGKIHNCHVSELTRIEEPK